jgi:DNA polymerase delta subunit 1
MSIKVKPYAWNILEHKEEWTDIIAWGHNEKNETVSVIITGFPYLAYVELPSYVGNKMTVWTASKAKVITQAIEKKYGDKGPEISSFCEKKKLYYYRGDKKYPFILLGFKNRDDMNFVTKSLEKGLLIEDISPFLIRLKIWETEIPHITKLIVTKKLEYCDWFSFDGEEEKDTRITSCTRQYKVVWSNINKSESNVPIYPSILSFDIETYSTNPNKLPDRNSSKDVAYLVTVEFKPNDPKKERQRYALLYGDSDEPKSGTLIKYKKETDMILGFADLVKKLDPDIMTGYNINGYDWTYLNTRLQRMDISWPCIGRLLNVLPKWIESNWESSGYGVNNIEYLDIQGRLNIDMLPVIKRNYRFQRYSLDFVSKALINASKHDVKPKEMFAIYKAFKEGKNVEESKKDMCRVVEYALQDSKLVIDLIDKLGTSVELPEMSNVVYVTINDLVTRGQQIRCDSQLYKDAFLKGFVVDKSDSVSRGYTGGAVENPIQGMHENILCLDFASLYPSIIIAYNISYETLIPPDGIISDKDCHVIEFEQEEKTLDDKEEKKEVRKIKYHYRFKKEPMGILPCLVKNLIDKRSAVRKIIKANGAEYDKIKQDEKMSKEEKEQRINMLNIMNMVLDKKQLAYKVSANSIYGFLGVGEGARRPLTEGARCVTAIGRMLIKKAADYLKDKYNARIIYGDTDSVMFDLGITDRKIANAKGRELAEEISKIFPPPLRMEFEKAMDILCFKKKKYAAALIKDDGSVKVFNKDGKLDLLTRGILIVRRDNFKLVRDMYSHILACIFERKSLKEVMEYVEDKIQALYDGRIKVEELAIIKSIAASYKSDTYSMKVFADNLRADGKPPAPGERVDYIIVKSPDGETKTGPRMRSLEQLQEKKEPIDYQYYLKSMCNPLNQLISIGYASVLSKYDHILNQRTNRCKVNTMKELLTLYYNAIWQMENEGKKVVVPRLSQLLEKKKKIVFIINKKQ